MSDIVIVDITKDDIRRGLNELLSESVGMKRTGIRCICGGDHYMAYPINKDREKITALPCCPVRIKTYSKSISLPLERILGELKYEK